MTHLVALDMPSRRFPIQPSAVVALSVIGLCHVNAVWACTDFAQRPDPSPAVHTDRPIRHVETLTVNTSNSERYVADDTCEAEGIEEIRRLVKLSRFEEMWVFLPRAQPSERCE